MTDIETDYRLVADLGLSNAEPCQRLLIETPIVSPLAAAMALAKRAGRPRYDGSKSVWFGGNGRWPGSFLRFLHVVQHIAEVPLEPFHTFCADQC
jgi:hypothetical protein